MNRFVLTLSIFVIMSLPAWGADWQIEMFDRSQNLDRTFVKQEEAFIVGINPDLKAFYEVWIPFRESTNKMERYIFLKQLKENPELIDWSNPYFWGHISTNDQIKLAEQDSTFRNLYQNHLGLREVFRGAKELTRLRNQIINNNKYAEAVHTQDQKYHQSLMLLAEEAKKNMANQKIKRTENASD